MLTLLPSLPLLSFTLKRDVIFNTAMNRITSQQLNKQQRVMDAQRTALANDPSSVLPPIPDVVYPVVIIEGFLTKENARQHFIYDMLAEWAALLAEYHIAQVVFVSNNPAVTKFIGRGESDFVIFFLVFFNGFLIEKFSKSFRIRRSRPSPYLTRLRRVPSPMSDAVSVFQLRLPLSFNARLRPWVVDVPI